MLFFYAPGKEYIKRVMVANKSSGCPLALGPPGNEEFPDIFLIYFRQLLNIALPAKNTDNLLISIHRVMRKTPDISSVIAELLR